MKSKMIQKKIIATAISVCLILAVFAGAFVLYSEGFFVKKTDTVPLKIETSISDSDYSELGETFAQTLESELSKLELFNEGFEVKIGSVDTSAVNAAASLKKSGYSYTLDLSIPKGETGNNGQSAYDAAKSGGYTGTQTQFCSDLAAMNGLASWFAGI